MKARAFCLGVPGFTSPPIGQALATDHGQQIVVPFGFGDLEGNLAPAKPLSPPLHQSPTPFAGILTVPI